MVVVEMDLKGYGRIFTIYSTVRECRKHSTVRVGIRTGKSLVL